MNRNLLIALLFFLIAYLSQLWAHTLMTSVATTISLFCLLICIIFLPILFIYKLLYFTMILYIGRINFHLYFAFIISICKGKKSDIIARESIYNAFSAHFELYDNLHTLPKFPTIIVSNYCYDRAENLAPILIPRSLTFISGYKFVQYSKIDRVLESFIIRKGDSNAGEYDTIKNKIREMILANRWIFAYVGQCCKQIGTVSRLRTGIFRIAQELGIGITPVYIDYFKLNQGIIVPQKFQIVAGETFFIKNKEEIQNRIDSVRNFFIEKIREKID